MMPRSRSRVALALAAFTFASVLQAQAPVTRRPIAPNDVYHLRGVSEPQLSPDGNWVAYTVRTVDSTKDKRDSNIWMTSWDGTQTVQLTSSKESESTPRWSPDGRYLAFLASRQDDEDDQVWLLDRRGGEAQRLTQLKGGVNSMEWSPDSKRLALVAAIESDSTKADTTKKRPVVIDRYLYKEDVEGYLTTSRTHLLLFDIASRKVDTLTSGDSNDDGPRWSPDGTRIAFVRSSIPEPGTGEGSDVYVVAAAPGATPKQLTAFPGPDNGALSWSPDGVWVAFFRTDDPRWYAYQMAKLAIVRSDGSTPARVLTSQFDRPLDAPTFSADGQSVLVMVDDDRAVYLARVNVASGAVERLDREKRALQDYSAGTLAGARIAELMSTPVQPAEVFAFENGALRQLSHQNDSLFATLSLASGEDLTSRSADGTEVHSILVRPASAPAGTRLPLILFIHGGPNGQSDYSFSMERQIFAAGGYAVLSPNYRGSDGRGLAFQRAIYGDWGNKEVVDLQGAVDQAVKSGIADPDRLGIGGWSYGGILTDYMIATTPRFKAAVSGAGSALQLSMYGTDEYIVQYELELGPPWKNRDLWLKVSYPFFNADKIKTPTLFMGGEADFNVPIIGGQQMYQALRELGVPTQLVIYPDQYHGLTRPSFIKDRLERYVAWFDRYLKSTTATPAVSH
ncbi:MAG TPA: S9 family peptidase [Gemmatimonadales bacterium]|nr:S9 family peptidase [Gemmatimonadales bacterium]